jgi:hypothetical protein
MAETTLTPHDLRAVGVQAGCDPRTVRAFLDGKRTHSTMHARITKALKDLGFEAAIPQQPTKKDEPQ